MQLFQNLGFAGGNLKGNLRALNMLSQQHEESVGCSATDHGANRHGCCPPPPPPPPPSRSTTPSPDWSSSLSWSTKVARPVHNRFHELDHITNHLESSWPSMNAILAAEYNTPAHAERLVLYYQQRPHLAQYTLEKELQRLQYQVHVKGDDQAILTDPKQIAHYFTKHHPSTTTTTSTATTSTSAAAASCPDHNNTNVVDWNQVLLGASNQSLLADLIHGITGPDRLIRPQYSPSCSATQCRFQLNMTQSAVVVSCHAEFEMSLPCRSKRTGQLSRLVVATFCADVVFQPSLPMIHYQITKLNVSKQNVAS